MKLLSLLLLFTTLYSTTLTLYPNNKAYLQTIVLQNQNTITSFPESIDFKTIYFKKPHITQFSYTKKSSPTTQQLIRYFLNKTVQTQHHNDVILKECLSNSCLVQQEKKLFFIPKNEIIFPYLPKEIVQPNKITIINPKHLPKKLQISYFFEGINYKTHYQLRLNKEKAQLLGYFDIINTTNQTIKSNTTTFMIYNRPNQPQHPIFYKTLQVADDAPIKQKESKTYTLYNYNKPITLQQHQHRVITFLQQSIAFEKRLQIKLSNPYYIHTQFTKQPTILISFKSPKTLPQGDIAVYDQKNFLNTNFIKNTPKNKQIQLQIGKDFFTSIEQKPIKFLKTKTHYDITIKYTITNNSNINKTINILIPYTINTNHVIKTKQPFQQINANQIQFTLKIEPHSTKSFQVLYKGKL